MIEPIYLGDAVYATDMGFQIMLTTDHHQENKAGNVIFLERVVMNNLMEYIKRRVESEGKES